MNIDPKLTALTKRLSRRAGLVLGLVVAVLVWPALEAGAQTVRDEVGRTVELPDRPARIIGLTPSLTEVLFGLGLGQRLVGATTWADYPPAAKALPRVGGYVSPNAEKIISLKPDLVLASREGNPPWLVDQLTRAGVPVFVTWPQDPKELPQSLARLGQICGAAQAGRRLAGRLQDQFDQVAHRLRGAALVPTLMVIGSQPLVSVGAESFNGRVLTMAAARNVAAGAPGPWPKLSLEYVLQARPQVVVVSTMERGQDLQQSLDFWRQMPGLKDRPDLRVESISSDLIDRPGPRLGQGLHDLARIIHPERFEPDQGRRP
ncbi:MAG: ABC transporter substrate-binding protein [Deltaproteobacteria bacterium]|nr:ABC transporter substrate-binding protein [Deltaproteobacteria bacterium]